MKCSFILAVHLFLGLFVAAQHPFNVAARLDTNTAGTNVHSTGFSGTGSNIDVVFHRVHWVVNPNASANISGTVTTYFKTIAPNVASISFDFIQSSFESSIQVKYHDVACSYSFPSSGNVNILQIHLPNIITNVHTLDSITISYAGIPVEDGMGGGFVRETYIDQFGSSQHYITTLSESYEDRNWWPCKADMQDKIDSMDITVTVPWNGADTFWVASNGILVDSAIIGLQRTFEYKTRYPIASYLVFLSAAKYHRYYDAVRIGETNTPSYYYLLAGKHPAYYTNTLDAMRKMNPVMQVFSNKIGAYPFKDEKHGYYDGLVGASGMEHQTFSGIASNALTSLVTLVHELMHQWFGDNVTFGTWNDLWLAEGFARYGEILAAEMVPELGYSAYNRRNARKNAALALTNASAWIPDADIASSQTIWSSGYGSAVYERGCMIVSMLRNICGDEKFFAALKNYQTVLKGKSASTDSLQRFFNDQLGMDIGEFFKDYVGGSGNGSTAVGGRGNPIYTIKWNSPAEKKLLLGVQSQTKTSNSNVSYFNGPVAVRAIGQFPGQDTTIIFFDWGNGQLSRAGNGLGTPVSGNALMYHLSFTPIELRYDDSARTLSTGSTFFDTSFKGYTWLGLVNSNWLNAFNWEACCGVPPANADVTIATVTHAPVLASQVQVNTLTINDTKHIDIAAGTLTINGEVKGNGFITGSVFSKLIIGGHAGILYFMQGGGNQNGLQVLTILQGASAIIGNNIKVQQVTIHPTARLEVNTGAHLTTH